MGSYPDKVENAAEIDRLALAVAREPGSKAFIPLAEEYGKAGMWEEAAAVLEDGLKTYPNFITAMVALGRAYDQMNQPIKATAILEEAVKLSPENLRAHRTLAKIYAAQGQKDTALRSCRVILAVNPQDQEALSMCTLMGVSAAEMGMDRQKRSSGLGKILSGQEHVSASGQLQKRPPGDAVQESRGSASVDEADASGARKDAVIAQLEQWLTLIHSRRRDQGTSQGHSL
jgi:tetratricopeptide (TPR) repeat protein